jgi:uncharacterized membrane-anchored protein
MALDLLRLKAARQMCEGKTTCILDENDVQDILFIAKTGIVGRIYRSTSAAPTDWVHPYSKAHSIKAHILHKRCNFPALITLVVIVKSSVFCGTFRAADIGTKPEGRLGLLA